MSNKLTRFFARLWRKLFGGDKDKYDLPTNPVCPENGMAEMWTFLKKDYDQSWRVRFPTFFANSCGHASYCVVGGIRFNFRSYDTDGGARRPSYQYPQVKLQFPVLCVLHDDSGAAVAWFKASGADSSGRLP